MVVVVLLLVLVVVGGSVLGGSDTAAGGTWLVSRWEVVCRCVDRWETQQQHRSGFVHEHIVFIEMCGRCPSVVPVA